MSARLPFARPTLDEATVVAVASVIRSAWITSGPNVARFEADLSGYLGGRTVRTMTSGTAALELALLAAGIGPGDEVIVPAMSFAASANVVLRVGARPVFVDVELASRNIDVARIEAAITRRTRAIMPVHFAGLPVDMDRLLALCAHHKLRLVEDAAHAIGTLWRGKRIGSFGDLTCFSFHPNKNMTTIEGGAIAVANPAECRVIDAERFHGIEKDADGNVDVIRAGGKYNLSDISAVIGIRQLAQLDGFSARRRQLADIYFERFGGRPPGVLPARGDDGHCWNMFTLLLPFKRLGMSRVEFIKAMSNHNIALGIHYPCIPALSAYRQLGFDPALFPNASRVGEETVTLPLFPTMADDDVHRVCDAIGQVLGDRA
jgi:dTDP-4-amino-4,6-dideoxygalactose transaminase